jgi:hypothetical protein
MSDKARTRRANRKAIKIGTLRDVGLTKGQRRTLRQIYSVVAPCLRSTFDDFESDFCRELFPEREIRIWTQIASAFDLFRKQSPSATDEELQLALQGLVVISMGASGHAKIPAALLDELAGLYGSSHR